MIPEKCFRCKESLIYIRDDFFTNYRLACSGHIRINFSVVKSTNIINSYILYFDFDNKKYLSFSTLNAECILIYEFDYESQLYRRQFDIKIKAIEYSDSIAEDVIKTSQRYLALSAFH
jgi:hypothetical protein